MKIEKIQSATFCASKQSKIKKIINATSNSTDLKVIKNYVQYLKAYGLNKKPVKTA